MLIQRWMKIISSIIITLSVENFNDLFIIMAQKAVPL